MQPSFFAILPAFIRYDKDLTANAKLLYCEITALCNAKGYCWASNDYFSKLYGVSERSITGWINELRSKEYIFVAIRKGNKGTERSISLNDTAITAISPDLEKVLFAQEKIFQCAPEKNCVSAPEKNFHHNNTSINNNELSKDNSNGELSDFQKFEQWILKFAKNVAKLQEPFTEEQYKKIKTAWPADVVKDVLQAMHNKKDLLRSYVSAYATCRAWCKRRQPAGAPGKADPPTANDKIKKAITQQTTPGA